MVFDPTTVAEVAAGYWWDPEVGVTNLGATNFAWAEANGKTAANQVQATVASQPSLITTNGLQQFSFGGTSTGNDFTQTAAALQAGWTGATMLAGWFCWPNAITGSSRYFVHYSAGAGNRRFVVTQTPTNISLSLSVDGTAAVSYVWPPFATPSLFHYYEFVFDPSLAATLRGALYIDRVLITPSISPSGPASIFDANTAMQLSNFGPANAVTVYRGPMFYTNGIPSDADRDLLMAYKAPVILPVEASGTPSAPKPTAAGTAVVLAVPSASGTPSAPGPTVTGTAAVRLSVSGSLAAPRPTATGALATGLIVLGRPGSSISRSAVLDAVASVTVTDGVARVER